MAKLFAVIAKTTDHESVLDSIWEDKNQADDRMYKIWEYPTIFRAEIKSYGLNEVDVEMLSYEFVNEYYDEDLYESEW